MDALVGEELARQGERNREFTQIYANSCDRSDRRAARLATRSQRKDSDRDVFRAPANSAVGTTALPTHQLSAHSRPLAFIGGLASIRGCVQWQLHAQLLDISNPLTQVVDFHDNFTYFYIRA